MMDGDNDSPKADIFSDTSSKVGNDKW